MKSKQKRYEQSEYYREKAADMEALTIVLFLIGYVLLLIPTAGVLQSLLGLPEKSAFNWAYVTLVPSVICSLRYIYFSFRAWLADPYKNI